MSPSVAILLLGILVVTNYALSRSVLYPPFLFSGIWFLDLLLYNVDLVNIGTIHSTALAVVTFGAFLFSVGGGLAYLTPKPLFALGLKILHSPKRKNVMRYTLVATLAFIIVLFARRTIAAASIGLGTSFLERARNAQFEGDGGTTIFSYIVVWSVYAAVLLYIEKPDYLSWVMIALAFVSAILSTGRTHLLLLMSALTCLYLLKTERLSISSAARFARWPMLAFIALWVGLIFTTKDTSVFGQTIGGTIALFLVGYIVGPVLGLDYVLEHASAYTGEAHHTFKFFLSIGSALHLIAYAPPPFIDAFAPLSFPTNVYTVYKFYYTDFGFTGMFATIAVIGFCHTLLYFKARAGSDLGRFLFALSVFPVLMSIFDDHYSALGSLLDETIIGFIYFALRGNPLRFLPKRRTSLPGEGRDIGALPIGIVR